MFGRTLSLFLAVASNVFLVGLFYRALTSPVTFTDFIYRTGIMIFMIEFMTLHSSGMLFGSAQQERRTGKRVMTTRVKVAMFAFYNLMVLAFASFTGQWLAALYFAVSLGGKAVFSRSIDPQKRLAPVAAGVTMLLLSTFAVVLGAKLLADWFPFPAAVRSARPPGQSGLFVSTPQTLMAWGVLYFSLMSVCEVMIFRRDARGTRAAQSLAAGHTPGNA